MGERRKNIDELVAERVLRYSELAELGQEISNSATLTVVGFIDLVGSTQMKQERAPEAWLAYVFQFLRRGDQLVRSAGGTVIKRIGDELMVTFPDVDTAEKFLALLSFDEVMKAFSFKISFDFGNAFHFRFIEHLEDDPYGYIVDRCARISKLATAGVILCTKAYSDSVQNGNLYKSVGKVALKGINTPEELFSRSLYENRGSSFLEPVMKAINDSAILLDSFRSEGRRVTTSYLQDFASGSLRPFVARELLNFPKLPYSHAALQTALQTTKQDERKKYLGYIVELEVPFLDCKRKADELHVEFGSVDIRFFSIVTARMPISNLDTVRGFSKGKNFLVRGVIEELFIDIRLNYVDLRIIDEI